MAVIDPKSAGLLELFVNDFALIPKFSGASRTGLVFGSTLAPWPNRLEDGSYEFDSQRYRFAGLDGQNNKNHGLVLDQEFSVVDRSSDSVTLSHNFGTDAGYPFDLELSIRYQLLADGLRVSATATNHGPRAPFAIGFHPYFLTGSSFSLSAAFTHRGVSDSRQLPIAIEPIPGLEIDQDSEELATLDHCFMGGNQVVVTRPDGRFVVRALENLPYFMLYRPSDKVFEAGSAIAIEPMSAPANVFRNEIESVVIEASETKSFVYEIRTL